MIWKPIIGVLALLLMSGCGFTPYGNFVRDAVKMKGAQAYDEGLKNSEWALCELPSIGSIKRKYGGSRERMKAYNDFCSGRVFNVMVPRAGAS